MHAIGAKPGLLGVRLSALAALAVCLTTTLTVRAESAAVLGQSVEGFSLKDYRGKQWSLDQFADRKAVVLVMLGTECPLAKLYGPRLAQLAAEFEPQGVAFLGICANQQDNVTELNHYARVHGIEFPLLKDLGNQVADALHAQRTPEVFVLDAQRKVRYHGRIDDQYGFQTNRVGYQRAKPDRRDLAEALGELLAGKPVSQPDTAVHGCLIGRVRQPNAASEVTYSKQISRIFNANCVACHREGQIAPFALSNYQEAVGWAEMIREVVEEQRMPPWHADPRYGDFANDARLSEDDKQAIYRWVDAGAPEGNPNDLPEPPQFASGWMIPEPDEVIYMRDEPYDVPAEGVVDYQRFVVELDWPEDRWLKAIEPRPGNPAVVHHVVMYLMPPDGPKKGAAGRLRTDWIAAYAPGLRPLVLPDDMARYVPKGSKLIFELHYTPNGTAQPDRSYLGVVFADASKVKREVAVKNAGNFTFKIPPGDGNCEVESHHLFRDETLLLSVSPHMHVRGKDFYYELIYPDGKVEPILSVPQYDFAWQTTYWFKEPKRLPKGTKMHCVAHFDNSTANLNNPDPTQEVKWGEQTFEEMMFGWFEMAIANQDLTQPQPPPVARTQQFLKNVADGGVEVDQQLREVASKSLEPVSGESPQENFKFFAYYLCDTVPQLDRVCITYVEDGDLRVQAVEELNGVKTILRTTSTTFKAKDQELADYSSRSEPTVNADLNKAKGSVLGRMAKRGLTSSLHVPIQFDGRQMSVNFWSEEPDAFPPAAVKLLTEVAAELARKR